MADRYEYYITGDDDDWDCWGARWPAQTFTPATAHKITSVKLRMYRTGSPGTVTVSIRATDGSGHPNGEDLCVGTVDGDGFHLNWPGDWEEITLGAGANLEADTKYAIVVRALSGNFLNKAWWHMDATSPTYDGGCVEFSTSSGDSWTAYSGQDFMFEEWGEPSFVLEERTFTDGIEFTDTPVKYVEKVSTDAVAFTDTLVKRVEKVITDAVAFTDDWSGYALLSRIFSDGIALGDALLRRVEKVIADGIAFTDTPVKHVEKVIADGIAFTDTLVKHVEKVIADGIAFTDTVARLIERVFTDGIHIGELMLKWRWLRPLRRLLPFRILESEREDPPA